MTTIPTSRFSAATVRDAYSARDAEALIGQYADDATIEMVDVQNTPSTPQRIEGKDAVRAYFAHALARDMTHEVDIVAVGDDSAAYVVRCAYPDGTKVVCASTSQLRDGQIVREIVVQAWDA